jgi:hypothetical protein
MKSRDGRLVVQCWAANGSSQLVWPIEVAQSRRRRPDASQFRLFPSDYLFTALASGPYLQRELLRCGATVSREKIDVSLDAGRESRPIDFFIRGIVREEAASLGHGREAHDVERALTDIGHGDCALELLGHGVHLVFGAPSQHSMPVGREHGRTIPLTEKSSTPAPGNSKMMKRIRRGSDAHQHS